MNKSDTLAFLLSAIVLSAAFLFVIAAIAALIALLFASNGLSSAFTAGLLFSYVGASILLGFGAMTWFIVRRGPELTVIVAYFIQPTTTIGGQADELLDLASSERYAERLRKELGLPTAEVHLFREGEWGMPAIATQQDLDDTETFTQFLGHAAIALDRLQVADEIVTRFTETQFEVLSLPTSGRIILFQAISAPRYKLGQLV